jgi:superkiller protein 3
MTTASCATHAFLWASICRSTIKIDRLQEIPAEPDTKKPQSGSESGEALGAHRKSDRADLMADAAGAMIANGMMDEARGILERALEIHPSNTRARLALIDCYRSLEMPDSALPLYEGLLDYDPAVRYNYATMLAQLGHYEEAVEQFQILTQAAPTMAPGFNNYGTVLRLMGNLQGAAEQFRRALEVDPNFTDARNNLTFVLASLEKEAPAAEIPTTRKLR